MTERVTEVLSVDFSPKRAEPEDVGLRVKRKDYLACQHAKVVIDEEHRAVQCKACGQTLDPAWVLLAWARNWERYASQVKALRDEVEHRTKEIARLRADEQNIKARIRTAKIAEGRTR